MLTNYNFYEGVPVGPENFAEFYNAVYKNSDAIMRLAFDSAGTVEASASGGSLHSTPIGYKVLEAPTGGSGFKKQYYVLSSLKAIGKKDPLTGQDIFSPEESKGIVFGKTNKRFFTEEINYIRTPNDSGENEKYKVDSWTKSVEDLKIQHWETVATAFNVEDYLTKNKRLTYTYNIPKFPFRLIKIKNSDGSYYYDVEEGIMDLRYNGIPQISSNGHDVRFHTTTPASVDRYLTQPGAYTEESDKVKRIIFNSLNLGAEHPSPVAPKTGKYVHGTVEGMNLSEWLEGFGTVPSSTTSSYIEIRFPFSNFSLEQGHIILRREFDEYFESETGDPVYRNDTKYMYLQEDISGGSSIQEGFYKIVDKAKGIIRINLTPNLVLNYLREYPQEVVDKIRFTILSPEQLLESFDDVSVSYKSRYGKVYTGSYLDTELITINFESGTGRYAVNRINRGINVNDTNETTDVLYTDRTSSAKTVVLAIKYPGIPVIQTEPQKLKYIPDIISMYYTALVPRSSAGVEYSSRNTASTVEDLTAFIEVNKSSWYNQDVKFREYNPVNRAERAYVSIAPAEYIEWLDSVEPSAPSIPTIKPDTSIFRYNSGTSKNYYMHKTKVEWPQHVGKIEEYVRRDAAIPEPHFINPPIIKTVLAPDEPMHVPASYQFMVARKYTVEGTLTVDGEVYIL